nr:G protein alpha-a subunit [Lymnaea stagnalis]
MSKGGRAAVARSRSIDHQLDEERERREKEVQILIIGGPGAGKSTFIKQLRLHYGDQFPPNERRLFHDQILQNVAMGLVHLIEHMERMGLQFETPEVQDLSREFRKKHPRISIVTLIKKFKEENEKAEEICPVTTRAELTKRLSSFDVYNPEVPNVDDMHTLWADPAMQICFEKRNKFETDKLTHSSEYFLLHIGRICSKEYLASVQDILLIRWPTLGVQEHKFMVDGLLYRMIDVAGQRSLRKKWIHFFDEVAAVAFFVNLTAYDEFTEEDPTVNSLQDSLQAFAEISHSQFLDKTDFILFLNKKDLFANKLKTSSIATCFPDYKGPNTVDASLKYIKEQFLQSKPAQKQVYSHATCAIDVPHMKDLLATVVDCIVDINVKRSKNY